MSLLEVVDEVPTLPATGRKGDRAARVETAARRREDRIGHLSSGEGLFPNSTGLGHGDRGEQSLGVRMLRVSENRLGRTCFHNATEVHDRDSAAAEFRS